MGTTTALDKLLKWSLYLAPHSTVSKGSVIKKASTLKLHISSFYLLVIISTLLTFSGGGLSYIIKSYGKIQGKRHIKTN